MPSPFPGMNPYLEDPEIWSGVHAAFLAGIFDGRANREGLSCGSPCGWIDPPRSATSPDEGSIRTM